MFPNSGSILTSNWKPVRADANLLVASLVVASTADHLSIVLETPRGADHRALKAWLSTWLMVRVSAMRPADRTMEACFLYVDLSRLPVAADQPGNVDRRGPVVEFGAGSQPLAPEDWVPLPLESLIMEAVHLLA